ncbi:MAG: ABC transporter permease [Mediterranea sp.]|jgi:ABC-type antimicrobial peptide transport system permease subunit|nr:ABC transporter permease [Mediterranea sp.]
MKKQLLSSLRVLSRFRAYTVINLVGLIVSVASALILIRYVHQERSVDSFIPHLDRTFFMTCVTNGQQLPTGSRDYNHDPNYRDPLDDPCVEKVGRFIQNPDDHIILNQRRYNIASLATDSSFLQMVPHPVVLGRGTLQAPTDALLTEKLAKRLFGNKDPLGQTLMTGTGKEVTVVGVIGQPPVKSSITFDLVLNRDLAQMWTRVEMDLVRLYRADDVVALNKKNSTPMKLMAYGGNDVSYQLIPMKGLYLSSRFEGWEGVMAKGNPSSLVILTLAAALLLMVGVFNYLNLHSVVMLKRQREFGVKRIFGARRRDLFGQLYTENFCLMAFALLCIWSFVELTRGLVYRWFDISVQNDVWFDVWCSIALLVAMPLLTSIRLRSLRSSKSRTGFLLAQYVISIALVSTAIYFGLQLRYLLHYPMGYRTQGIVMCNMQDELITNDEMTREQWEAHHQKVQKNIGLIAERMNASPLFEQWTYGSPPLSGFGTDFTSSTGEKRQATVLFMGPTAMKMFEFKLADGRWWDHTDQFAQYKFIVNKALLRQFHITDWHTATLQSDRRLWYADNGDMSKNPPYQIVGVVEDFVVGSLANADAPVAFSFVSPTGEGSSPLIAAIVPGKEKAAIAYLDTLYHVLNGKGDFEYSFLTDRIADQYKENRRTMRIYTTFAAIAIGVSCLGLFGLSLYDIRRRYREISIRKVNGATHSDIFRLLLRKYLYLWGVAFVLGTLASYIAISKMMESFYHRTPLSGWIFVAAGLLTVLLSLLTLSWQIRQALRVNPAETIKTE